ncbi:MAG: PBSX family phage terminase large subunit [Oscillospiraceae bacterium]|jgi:PBSX family phage terminase large subunit|nr:PBSX family phage terminase large subunit [Oscillospiraceae bacterium]
MRFKEFSKKQLKALTWWCDTSPHKGLDAIICDGAVRSGKTLCLSLSFAMWAIYGAPPGNLAMCGKTILSLKRNVVEPLCEALRQTGIAHRLKASENRLTIGKGANARTVFLYGGKDEGSAALIQGITLSGILLDEVALMPHSFVEQALARCSVKGSRFFMSCNPEHPYHWFYTGWILKAAEKNALYLHFTMKDNPSLSPEIISRYKSLYSGAFYDRFVLGKWVAPEGLVYPMFSHAHIVDELPEFERYAVSCDYGTVNPLSAGLWGESEGAWYRLREYYYDSKKSGVLKTDEEYADAIAELTSAIWPEAVVADPSAASFIACLRRRGLTVEPALNSVADGVRLVAGALRGKRLFFHRSCADAIREFSLYRWDEKAQGDVPLKRDDHAMDDIRYFAMRFLLPEAEGAGGFCAVSVARADDRGRPCQKRPLYG